MKPYAKRKPKPIPVARVKQPGNSWEAAVAAFLDNGRDPERKLSQATIDNYSFFLMGERTTGFRKEKGIKVPADMTERLLRDLERELQDAGAAPSTIASYHRCIKNFVGFCIREGFGGDKDQVEVLNQTLQVKGPKVKEPEMAPFTDAEKAKLRTHLADRPRDLMLLNLMLSTGARLAEVASLTLSDVIIDVPDHGLVYIREGKGGKDRHIPLSENMRGQLVRYVGKVRPKDAASDALFLTNRGDRNGVPKPLTTSAIQTLFKRLSGETGIAANPHKCRHTFATHAIDNGMDLLSLKKALGHSSLEMVSRYAHRSTASLQAAWKVWTD